MQIAFINGSPKFKDSNSDCMLTDLKPLLHHHEIVNYNFNKPTVDIDILEKLSKADAFVFAFPLYVDSIPSHLLSCLCEMEMYFKNKENNIKVYALVNSGFYDGIQNHHALEIIKNWCTHCNLTFGQGLGVGAGEMLKFLTKIEPGKGPKKHITIAYELLASNIFLGKSAENIFVSPDFPRFLYKLSGEFGWKQLIKKNGLKSKDLSIQR